MQEMVLWLFTIEIVYHWKTINNLVLKIIILQISKSKVILKYRIDVLLWHHPLGQVLKWINKQSLCRSLEKDAVIIGPIFQELMSNQSHFLFQSVCIGLENLGECSTTDILQLHLRKKKAFDNFFIFKGKIKTQLWEL